VRQEAGLRARRGIKFVSGCFIVTAGLQAAVKSWTSWRFRLFNRLAVGYKRE